MQLFFPLLVLLSEGIVVRLCEAGGAAAQDAGAAPRAAGETRLNVEIRISEIQDKENVILLRGCFIPSEPRPDREETNGGAAPGEREEQRRPEEQGSRRRAAVEGEVQEAAEGGGGGQLLLDIIKL